MPPTFNRLVRKIMEPLERRVTLMVVRAGITLVNDALRGQLLQVKIMEGFTRDDVENVQQYGFASRPFSGASAVLVGVSGSTDHYLAVATSDRRYRPTSLLEGETCLHTHLGIQVLACADGSVNLGIDPVELVARADRVDAELQQLRDKFNAHKHPTGTGPSGTPDNGPMSLVRTTTATDSVRGK